MPLPSRPTAVLLAAATLALAACGGNGGEDETSRRPAPPASPAAFPSAQGKATLRDLVQGLPQGPNLAPSVSRLQAGTQRFAFGLFDNANKQVNGAQVAVYTASASQTDVRGPYVARYESLGVEPRFRSRTTSADPDSAQGVYVVRLPVQRGRRVIIGLARLNGRLVATSAVAARVGLPGGPPDVGDRAIRVHTPTVASAGGDVSKIDTRVPPSEMHADDLANVLGRKPVFLVFATPALCQSRVCGPIVDEAEQLRARYGDRMAFIHMEVYNDNRLERGFRPQLRAWRLTTEPWVFVIDRRGRVAARFEGAASVRELQAGIERGLRT